MIHADNEAPGEHDCIDDHKKGQKRRRLLSVMELLAYCVKHEIAETEGEAEGLFAGIKLEGAVSGAACLIWR